MCPAFSMSSARMPPLFDLFVAGASAFALNVRWAFLRKEPAALMRGFQRHRGASFPSARYYWLC